MKLGRFGDVTVEQARHQAQQLRAQVSLGGDPVAEQEKRRAVPTLADFARERFIPRKRESIRSADLYEAQLRLRILPFMGRKALDEITQEDVAGFRRKLIADGLAAPTVNRHLAVLRAMFNLALRWQLYDGRNPADSPDMLREQHRDRFLTAAETQALVRTPDAVPSQTAASALALLILREQRGRTRLERDRPRPQVMAVRRFRSRRTARRGHVQPDRQRQDE